jgi:23S rRNA (uracil1939-C5)-methyltransferase
MPAKPAADRNGLWRRVTALVLRHLEPLTHADRQRLADFATRHSREGVRLQWWLQAGGPDTVQRLDSSDPTPLAYALPEFGIVMPFRPTDFTQVNPHINRVLVGACAAPVGGRAPRAGD